MTARDLTAGLQVTGTAQRDAWRTRELPPVEEVRPGLWSVPVPIPDHPLRYTLSYAFTGDTGTVIVDPGWDSADGQRALTAGWPPPESRCATSRGSWSPTSTRTTTG